MLIDFWFMLLFPVQGRQHFLYSPCHGTVVSVLEVWMPTGKYGVFPFSSSRNSGFLDTGLATNMYTEGYLFH